MHRAFLFGREPTLLVQSQNKRIYQHLLGSIWRVEHNFYMATYIILKKLRSVNVAWDEREDTNEAKSI